MNCDTIFISFKTKYIIKDLTKLKDYFDFGILDKSHELFSKVIKNAVGKFKTGTPKNLCIDKVCLLCPISYSFVGKWKTKLNKVKKK